MTEPDKPVFTENPDAAKERRRADAAAARWIIVDRIKQRAKAVLAPLAKLLGRR